MAPRGRAGTASKLLFRLSRLVARTRERLPRTVRTTAESPALDDVRRRLELMLLALHGREIRVLDAPLPERSWRDRVMQPLTPRHLLQAPAVWTDGDTVRLPRQLQPVGSDRSGLSRYRLLALLQAERIVRGTARVLPTITEPIERDLFLLRESIAAEARLARDIGGMSATLAAARRAALDARPSLRALTASERGVEAIVREALDEDVADRHHALADSTPSDSLTWARGMRSSLHGRYRGHAPVAHWGGVTPSTDMDGAANDAPDGNPFAPRDGMLPFEGRTAERDGAGAATTRADPTSEGDAIDAAEGEITAEQTPAATSGGAATTGGPASGDGALPHTRDDAVPPVDGGDPPDALGAGVQYPEWRYLEGRYRPLAVTVRERLADESESAWATETLQRKAPMIRRIRARFEPLRAQRTRLGQQREGEELDLAACVQALVDMRTGHTPSDRLYVSVRPARRAMTICLLVDVSGSTEQSLPTGQRIVDVAREAVLLAGEAFDALGDAYAMLSFSSRGARDVRIATVKDFHERNGPSVRQRIAGLEPGGNTRMGAAIRHASTRLTQQPLGRRLLLIVSDGRPNDFDEYYADAAVEDCRQAINEARAQGIFPFCITIDREDGAAYLPRIFGANGYTLIREPEQLPQALVRVVRQLLVR